jgi:hypothetical protein
MLAAVIVVEDLDSNLQVLKDRVRPMISISLFFRTNCRYNVTEALLHFGVKNVQNFWVFRALISSLFDAIDVPIFFGLRSNIFVRENVDLNDSVARDLEKTKK